MAKSKFEINEKDYFVKTKKTRTIFTYLSEKKYPEKRYLIVNSHFRVPLPDKKNSKIEMDRTARQITQFIDIYKKKSFND